MHIISLTDTAAAVREEMAAILLAALDHAPSAWHDMASARHEVAGFFGNPERFALGAFDGDRLVGWIGAIRAASHAWELHPLVVHPDRQRDGIGTRLVQALEQEARGAGICTLWLGTDDDIGGTTLFGTDLYPDVPARLAAIAPTAVAHPYTFYLRLGFAVTGVLPDATGPGRHDILMAKRIGA